MNDTDQDQERRGLSRVWAPIDWLADWLQNTVDTVVQERIAILCVLISIPVGLAGPFLPPKILQLLIYGMSAVALTLAGVSWLGSLQAKRAVEETAEVDGPPPPGP